MQPNQETHTDSTPMQIIKPLSRTIHLLATLQHLPQQTHQTLILTSRRDSLLICQLLVDLISRAVCSLSNPHIHTVPRWKCLFQPYPHSQSNHRSQRTMCNRRRNLHQDRRYGVPGRDVNVWEVDNREFTEGEGMFRVGDGCYQVYNPSQNFIPMPYSSPESKYRLGGIP